MTPNLESLKQQITFLSTSLEARSPGIKDHLHIIHKNLKEDASLVTLLSPEEIFQIVSGLKVVTQSEILFSAAKAKGTKAKLSQLTADDL